LPRDLPRDWSV